jgi:hypothetical protein
VGAQIASQLPPAMDLNRSNQMTTSGNFRMTLTPEQKDQVRKATGKDAEAIELSVEELEERIAPTKKTAW